MNGLEAKGCRISHMLCLHNCRTQCTRDRLERRFRGMCNRCGDMRETSPWEGVPRPDSDRVRCQGICDRRYLNVQHGIPKESMYCALLECVMAYSFFDIFVAKALVAVAGRALNLV